MTLIMVVVRLYLEITADLEEVMSSPRYSRRCGFVPRV